MRVKLSNITFTVAVLAILFAIAAPGLMAQQRRENQRAAALFQEGSRAYNQKDYRLAIDKYAMSIALAPRVASSRFWKGLAHMYTGDYELALNELTAALDLGYEKPIDIYSNRWRIHFANKNYEAAMADVNSGLAIDAANHELQIARGDMSFVNKNYRDALDAYQKALVRTPNNAELYLSISKSYFNLRDTKNQVGSAQEAINKGTRFPGDAFLLLADGHQKLGNIPQAIAAFESAKAANPKNYEIYRSLADLYRSQNRFDEAIKTSRSALAVFGNDGNIFTDLSWYYSLANRHEEAVEAAKAGIKLLPDQYMAYTNLCRAYNDLEKPELAIRECNNALRLKPDDGETYFYLGRAHDILNKPADATRYYKRAVTGLEAYVKERPDYSDGFYLLGNAYFADNQRSKAIEAYNEAIRLAPSFARARYNLGRLLVVEKEKGLATIQYNALTAIDKGLTATLKAEIDKLP